MVLETIHSRDDLLRLTPEEQRTLCAEIRQFLVEHVSRTGGHLASNLGIVETTVAIETVFDTRRDRLVFDVGHQSYVHKILTGRMERFDTLRQYGGIAGVPKPCESECDAFVAGHASNAVSVALGMARARTLRGENYQVAALLGDGALTGGLAYEGLNNAGISREPMVVILNDNGMSITRNVGAISRYLARARLRPKYIGFKLWYRKATAKTAAGRKFYELTHKVKERMRRSLLGTTLFETLGFTYLGPVVGHDVEKVTEILRTAVALHEPVIVHLITQKGKGYVPAEQGPQKFHGIGKFDPDSGKALKTGAETFSDVFGKELTALAREDSRVCAITAAMEYGTGLNHFADALPNRFFDVGIAEEHAISMAAGMAKQGMLPVFAVYDSFLQRGYDMLAQDVSLDKLHVVFAVDRTGLVGADGETHHGCIDYLSQIPDMTVLCPASFAELRSMLRTALYRCGGPVAVRYPRGGEGTYRDNCGDAPVSVLRQGADVSIVTYGILTEQALAAAELLAQEHIAAQVVKLNCVTPLDGDAVCGALAGVRRLVVLEDQLRQGCVGQRLAALLLERGAAPEKLRLLNAGERLPAQGSVRQLYHALGLDAQGVVCAVKEVLS